jgi:hypothetical protein
VKRALAAAALTLLTAGVLVGIALFQRQPPLTGEDEIAYTYAQSLQLAPGATFTQVVQVQDRDLSQAQFLYQLDPPRDGVVHVEWASSDGAVFDRSTLRLPPTPPDGSRRIWFEATFWGPVAYWATIPVQHPPAPGPVELRLTVDPASPPLRVWTNAFDGEGNPAPFPPGTSPATATSVRIAVRTRYGQPQPLLLEIPTIAARMAVLAPAWERGAVPAILLVLLVAAAVAVTFAVALAPDPPPDLDAV